MYVQEKGILTPGSTPEFLKQLLLKRENAINSLSEIDSEIIAILKPPHSPLADSFEWREMSWRSYGICSHNDSESVSHSMLWIEYPAHVLKLLCLALYFRRNLFWMRAMHY